MDASRISNQTDLSTLMPGSNEHPAKDWQAVKAVLLEALDLEPSRRDAFLNGPAISPAMRAEVRSLLAHEDSAQDFMSLPAGGFAAELTATTSTAHIGQRIGIYETVSELGLGGMGVVYLASRRDGKFEQKVAIKLLKREFNTAQVRQIFEREKEILATLSHPNIASLLDAGTTDDGIPYLVMEYIDGEPIDVYCQKRQLALDARLKLFNKVCDTVARAHRSLIVHRDLKPSNILVTNEGNPKLLDFGISKLLDVEAENSAGVTQLGAMTPQYASPEQIKGEPVTTATDVYSLGVVLFKILTGSLPNSLKGHSPTLPSEAARRTENELAYSPGALKGDLDNVVLKALRHEPDQRYQSVEHISEDLWRFIDGLPVRARPATLSYRVSKFVSRNKVQVIAAIFVVVALLVGIAVALSQAKSAREQARLAREQRDAAQQARERAEKTSRFMQSFLNYANPHWSGLGSRQGGATDFTVREALHDVVARMDTELADSPEVRADLHYTVAEVYAGSGERARSLQHFRTSLELYRQIHGDEHPKVARGIYYLSNFETNNETAKEQLRQAILIMRRTDPENVNLPHMLQALGERIARAERESRNASRLAEAEASILEAQSIFNRTLGENAGATVSTYSSLAFIALTGGDLARAESLREEVLRRYQKTHGGLYEHIWALVYVGDVKRKLGKEAEAETLFRQALELARKRWSADDRRLGQLVNYIKQARTAASGK